MSDSTATLRMLLLGDDVSASKALRQLASELDKTAKTSDDSTAKMEKGHGRIAAGLKNLGAGIAQGIGQGIVGVVSSAASAVGDFAAGSVEKFSSLEDATGAASVVFGDSMGKIIEQSKTAAGNLGMSKSQVIDAANVFGTFGKSAGLSGDSLAGFSTKMTGLAGDMASFKGTSPEQAIEAIGAALRGETEPIRAYGVMLDDASMRNEAMKMGLIKTTKEALTPQQKVLAAQALILKQTSDAQGDFARTSDSTANTQKRLSATMENLQASLGEKLAPAVTAVAQGVLDAIEFFGQFSEVGEGAGEVFGALGQALGALGEVVFPVLTGMIGKLVEGFGWLARQVAGMLRQLGKVPGFEWATAAADGLDKMAAGAEKAGKAIQDMPDRIVEIKAKQESKALDEVTAKLAKIEPKTVIAKAQGDPKGAETVKAAMDKLIDETVKAKTIGDPSGAQAVKAQMELLRDKYVTAVTRGDTSGAQEALDQLRRIAAYDGRAVKVQVLAGLTGSNIRMLQSARGNIAKAFAGGGIEDHSPVIVRPGDVRLFGEPETGGEAYIPFANDWRRPRAIAIWQETGRRIGVLPNAAGGLYGGGSGGGSLDGLTAEQICDAVREGARQGVVDSMLGRQVDGKIAAAAARTSRGVKRV